MTGDLMLLNNVISINGGYVNFAGNQGGYITGEGTLSNGRVSFNHVNYVKQLENNLLSVSQISDNGYPVLFDSTNCYILKPGISIPPDWVIIGAPRVRDLYLLNMNEAKPSSTTMCLVTKAT